MQRMDALPPQQAQDALAAIGHNDGLCERGISCAMDGACRAVHTGGVRITARYVQWPPIAP